MYECPNCAGNLKFDIASQQLLCEHCNTKIDPYSIQKETDAKEYSDEYEVTVFTCPQCGGEILSEDNTAATFCSFCGAATVLTSRIAKEKRPAHIIPFLKTKEDCREAYVKMMRRAVFAPKALKDKEHIEKFRGIYMPYWVYSFKKDGPADFQGKKVYRKGDYIYTDNYRLSCEIKESYQGLTYDASASFADSLSGAISPFDMKQGKEFTPTFLSGFYADTSDVDKDVYQNEAEEMVIEDGCKQLLHSYMCRDYHVTKDKVWNVIQPTKEKAELVMLPVWFLSYRNGDRVSYAVVNGQTGKAAAEIPVDAKKYLIGSAVLTVPIFIVLNLFFTFTPVKLLWLAVFLAVGCLLIANIQVTELLEKEFGEGDKGLAAARSEQEELARVMAEGREGAAKKKKKPGLKTAAVIIGLLCVIILPVGIPFLLMQFFNAVPNFFMLIIVGIIGLSIHYLIQNAKAKEHPIHTKMKKMKARYIGKWKEKIPILIKLFGGIAAALLILLINPVADWYYYGGAIVSLTCVAWAVMDIIKLHNELATRELPQFNKRGGDENA